MLLFNLAKAPEAQHNLAEGEEHQERLRRLFRRLLQTQKATGHELALRQVSPELAESRGAGDASGPRQDEPAIRIRALAGSIALTSAGQAVAVVVR